MNITLCYQGFVLSGAFSIQNQCKEAWISLCVTRILCYQVLLAYKSMQGTWISLLCYQGFVLSGAVNTINARGMDITLFYQDFVLSGAFNIQNQCKGHEYHFVLSGFLGNRVCVKGVQSDHHGFHYNSIRISLCGNLGPIALNTWW